MNIAAQPTLPGVRLRKPKPALEFETQCALVRMLDYALAPGWWFSAIPSGELRTKKTGARLKAMGLKPGMFDLLFISPDGDHHWLELKRKGERLNANQDEFRKILLWRLVSFDIASSFDEAVEILTGWGALRGKVSG